MADKGGYLLGYDAEENERLKWQNTILTKSIGYHIHPLIPSRLGQRLRVAELATGPGIFLLDLSAQLDPGSSFHGTDISSAAWQGVSFPENVEMSVVDAKELPARERWGRYDLVCVRFLNLALGSGDWERVARHACCLLRKGGALQWIEPDLLQFSPVLYTNPTNKTSALERAFDLALAPSGPNSGFFTQNLAPILEEVGFGEVLHQVCSSDRLPEMRRELGTLTQGAMLAIIRTKGELTGEEVGELKKEMEGELDAGAYLRADWHAFVGFKG